MRANYHSKITLHLAITQSRKEEEMGFSWPTPCDMPINSARCREVSASDNGKMLNNGEKQENRKHDRDET